MADMLTVLSCDEDWFRATKAFRTDEGEIKSQAQKMARLFNVREVAVTDITSLSQHLIELERDHRAFVIRGRLRSGSEHSGVLRRTHGPEAAFEAADRRWLCIDIDELPLPAEYADFNTHRESVVSHAVNHLPEPFGDASCHWQFSSSMGVKPGTIRLHLWFWLSRPLSDYECKAWLSNSETKVDRSLFSPVQPHYTAAPVFLHGMSDPVTVRSGLRDGLPCVEVPEPLPVPAYQPLQKTAPASRINGASSLQEIERDAAGRVINGREAFLYLMSIEATARLMKGRKPKAPLPTVEEIAELTWELFCAEAENSQGKYTIKDATEKARYRRAELESGMTFTARTETGLLLPAERPYFSLNPLPLAEAEAAFAAAIEKFRSAFMRGEEPRHVIRATMGLGKTRGVAELLARIVQELPGIVIDVYVPRHDLSDDFREMLEQHALFNTEVKCIRGRRYEANDGTTPCLKPYLVKALEDLKLPVRWNACYRSTEQKCEHYESCPYWQQFTTNLWKSEIRIMPHAYLGLPRNDDLSEPNLVVIDEGCLSSMHEKREMNLTDVTNVLTSIGEIVLSETISIGMVLGKPLKALREAGFSPAQLRSIKFDHSSETVDFDMNSDRLTASLKSKKARPHRAVEMLCEILAEEAEQHPERDEATRIRYRSNGQIVMGRIEILPFGGRTPLLILDATANGTVNEKLFGRMETVRIDAEQKAFVIQIYDRTGSNKSWAEQESKVEDLAHVLACRALYGDRVLCVSHKELACELREMDLPDGVAIEHFGNLRGKDEYKDYDTIFITGRNQPPPSDVEGIARALFWDDEVPLTYDLAAAFDKPTGTYLPTELRGYAARGEAFGKGVNVNAFTDQRIEAVHQQLREAETAQAIARLRLVRSETRKIVILLANLPVEMQVDRLVQWTGMMPIEADRILDRYGFFPLSPLGLRKLLPSIFRTEEQAKKFLQRSRDEGHETPFATVGQKASRMKVTFRELRDGKPYGRRHSVLFELPRIAGGYNGGAVTPIPLRKWQCIIENGHPDEPNSGWGPIYIDGYDWV